MRDEEVSDMDVCAMAKPSLVAVDATVKPASVAVLARGRES